MGIPTGGPEFIAQILKPCPAVGTLPASRMDPGNSYAFTGTVPVCLFTFVNHPSHDLVP
jgi:hypothetical protein